ncbi:acylphosphatase [Paucilactobacillus suebicus]|uniref:acylphosphatase n=1 Tax=Paucilactobacillus suebicus DSM 5007 = KCTC 3549 TaxID=1423807 RepID=A0A0R1W6E3_9LACO|nr:acylphosphatase [Paucilactobacillus suebicus]KRM13223.1 acylphosphatase [Paucilactobacillus suebicus DSM 5007 = KCTC 3549]
MKSVQINVQGIVQGVGFRWSVSKEARDLAIVGLISNLSDGTVYIEAQGSAEHIDQLIDFIKKGPTPFAKIYHMDVNTQQIKKYKRFYIK